MSLHDINSITNMEEVLNYAKMLDYGEFHTKIDRETGLVAIVAIHNVTLGPALGGCRCIEYPNSAAAFVDALRLARGMSFKNALCGIPHGGGKAVLIKPSTISNRKAYFEAYGRFINELGGRYITAVDSGTHTSDMDIIQTQTPFVTCLSPERGNYGDPSPYTALGVSKGIETAVQYYLKKDSLEGITVAIQGVGSVGYILAKLLYEKGAKLIVTDINNENILRCVNEFSAVSVLPHEIFSVECDVFAPCALGAVINDITIPQLKAKIVAGGANNQLAERRHGQLLKDRNILYAPDYLINAGGVAHAAVTYAKQDIKEVENKINAISKNLMAIFVRAGEENLPTNIIANKLACEIIHCSPQGELSE